MSRLDLGGERLADGARRRWRRRPRRSPKPRARAERDAAEIARLKDERERAARAHRRAGRRRPRPGRHHRGSRRPARRRHRGNPQGAGKIANSAKGSSPFRAQFAERRTPMPLVNVMVNGRAYTIACDEGEEDHLRELAGHVDSKVRELLETVGQVGDQRLLLMAALLMADEAFEAQSAPGSRGAGAGRSRRHARRDERTPGQIRGSSPPTRWKPRQSGSRTLAAGLAHA